MNAMLHEYLIELAGDGVDEVNESGKLDRSLLLL